MLAIGPEVPITSPVDPLPDNPGWWKYLPVISFVQPTYFEGAAPAVASFQYPLITAQGDAAYTNARVVDPETAYVIKGVYMGLIEAGAPIPDNRTYIVTVDITWVPVLPYAIPPAA